MLDLGISILWNNGWNGFHIIKETLYKSVTKCFKVTSARKCCFWLNNQLFNMAKSKVSFSKTVRNWPGFASQTTWLIMVFNILVAC